MSIASFDRTAGINEIAAEMDRRGNVIEQLEARLVHIDGIYKGAIDDLNHHQTQLDMDGVMVGVSRQALWEVLAGLEAALVSAPADPAPAPADVVDDWRDDPSADDRWNAGLNYGQEQLCNLLGVDPKTVNWDAATETLDGDVQSVIGNILTACFGDDWRTALAASQPQGWREITENDRPPNDTEVLMGCWESWPEQKWVTEFGLYGSTKGGWINGRMTHWLPSSFLPASPKEGE